GRARAPRGVALLERAAAEGQDRRFLRRLAQRADHAPRAARYQRRRVRARDRTGGAPGEDARRRGRAAPQVLVPCVEEGAEEAAEEGAREARGGLQTLRRGERGVPAPNLDARGALDGDPGQRCALSRPELRPPAPRFARRAPRA